MKPVPASPPGCPNLRLNLFICPIPPKQLSS